MSREVKRKGGQGCCVYVCVCVRERERVDRVNGTMEEEGGINSPASITDYIVHVIRERGQNSKRGSIWQICVIQ